MTQFLLGFLAALATLASIGLFVDFADRWTELVVTFLAALLWGVVGLSSFDVHAQSFGNEARSILPMVYVGIGLAMSIGAYGMYDLVVGIGEQASDADLESMLP